MKAKEREFMEKIFFFCLFSFFSVAHAANNAKEHIQETQGKLENSKAQGHVNQAQYEAMKKILANAEKKAQTGSGGLPLDVVGVETSLKLQGQPAQTKNMKSKIAVPPVVTVPVEAPQK